MKHTGLISNALVEISVSFSVVFSGGVLPAAYLLPGPLSHKISIPGTLVITVISFKYFCRLLLHLKTVTMRSSLLFTSFCLTVLMRPWESFTKVSLPFLDVLPGSVTGSCHKDEILMAWKGINSKFFFISLCTRPSPAHSWQSCCTCRHTSGCLCPASGAILLHCQEVKVEHTIIVTEWLPAKN